MSWVDAGFVGAIVMLAGMIGMVIRDYFSR
jgi:hypothetical protein